MNEHIVIITGATPLSAEVVEQIPHDAVLIAVDGGLDHALAVGLEPTHLVGDLDSVTDSALTWAARHASISRHPTDKDQTDTELALTFAVRQDPERITLIGGGDRLDHTIAGIGALGALTLTSVPLIDAWWDAQHLHVIHGPGSATLRLVPGSILSLLALHGPCTNVTLVGARWELDHFDLDPVVGIGVSNEVPDAAATADGAVEVSVSLSGGVLTIFDTPAPPPASTSTSTPTPTPTSTSTSTSQDDTTDDEHSDDQ